jgi:hypothetical protein
VDGRPDDLLEEPLYVNGVLIRRWDELADPRRPDAAVPPRRRGRGWLRIPEDVPAPRLPQTLRWESQPTAE